MRKLLEYILIIIGSISIFFGVLGIFIPLLPTTPFLLLGAACYIRSSDKLYKRLLSNKYLGSYIRDYREKRGIPLRAKITSISLIWITIIISVVFFIPYLMVKILVVLIASAVTWHLLSLKTIT